jgi:hypothetical protein
VRAHLHDRELIASKPSDQITICNSRPETATQLLEQGVPRSMSKRVVHAFEPVKIQQIDDQLLLFRRGFLELLR